MIQDIYPHKLDNHFDIDAKPDNDSIVLYFTKEGILHKLSSYKDYENYLFFPTVQDFITKDGTFPFEQDALTYLFSVDDAHYFLLEQEPTQLPKGFTFTPIRNLRKKNVHPKHRIFAGITGFQLRNWYKNNRFCGCCGNKTVRSTTERALICPSCGHVIYPRIVPAVIVGICNDDKILVTKYRTGFAHYALVAGFTEIGETLEETVQREVLEETGLRVKNIRYYKLFIISIHCCH